MGIEVAIARTEGKGNREEVRASLLERQFHLSFPTSSSTLSGKYLNV